MNADMRLDDRYQLVPHTNGDAALVTGNACFLQALRLEAAACEGELWYDPDWGWSLLEFKDMVQDELTLMEIEQRVRGKLEAHPEIAVESIRVEVDPQQDTCTISVSFRLLEQQEIARLQLIVGRLEIEVIDLAE